MSNTQPVEEINESQLREMIRTEAKNLNMEEIGERINDGIAKGFKAWEEKSARQRRKEESAAMRDALFGNHAEVKGAHRFGTKAASLLPALLHSGVKAKAQAIEYATQKKMDDTVVKALEASSFGAGGALIPEEYSTDFIAALRNKTVVRRMGANVIDMPSGALNIGKQNATATAYWVGEGGRITASEQTFQNLQLSAKKLGILVPISNDIIEQAPAGFEAMIRDDMEQVAAIAEDAKFIRGDGTSNTPKGIKNWLAPGQLFNANATVNLANVTADLLKVMYLVSKSNVPEIRNGWMFHPRIKFYLMSLRTDDGYPVFLEELRGNMLYGAPVGITKNIPADLDKTGTAANDETEIYFGDFSQVVIGQTREVRVEESSAASFVQGAETIHGFQDDISVAKLTLKCDLAVRHNSAFGVIEAADWGKSFDA